MNLDAYHNGVSKVENKYSMSISAFNLISEDFK